MVRIVVSEFLMPRSWAPTSARWNIEVPISVVVAFGDEQCDEIVSLLIEVEPSAHETIFSRSSQGRYLSTPRLGSNVQEAFKPAIWGYGSLQRLSAPAVGVR